MTEPGQVDLPGPYGGHPGAVFTVAYSPGGSLLASGGWDGTVRLWSPRDGIEESVLAGHVGQVRAVAFAPDGSLLASGGRDRTIRLWDTTARTSAGVLRGSDGAVLSLAFGPSRSLLASASGDGSVRLWNPLDGSQACKFPEDARALAFSSDGTLATGGSDGRIRLRSGVSFDAAPTVIEAHRGPILALAYAPDQTLASVGDDGFVRLWNPPGGKDGEFQVEARAVAFSPDGHFLASARSPVGIVMWDRRDDLRPINLEADRRPYELAFAPDGAQLASANDAGDVRLYDLAGEAKQLSLTGHVCEILSVACSPNGELVATGDVDGVIRLWEASAGVLVHRLTADRDWVRSLAFDAAGRLLAAAVGGRVQVWDVSSGIKRVATVGDGRRVMTATAFAAAAAGHPRLVTADADDQLVTWDIIDGKRVAGGEWASSVAVDPSGTVIVGLGSDGLVRKWELGSGLTAPRVFGPSVDRPRCVALRPDGQVIAAAGSDGVITLWNAADASRPVSARPGHDGTVRALAFSPNGALLASVGDDGTLRLWDAADAAPAWTLADRSGVVRALAFSADGTTLVTVGDDGGINRWDPHSGRLLSGRERQARPLPSAPRTRSDEPSRADEIGVGADVEVLATLISAASTEPPLAVALLGEWGAGKSSVMLQVQDAVVRRTRTGDGAYVSNVCQVRFNAWHYSDEQVWTGLISHLLGELAGAAADNRTPPDPDQVRAERDHLAQQRAEQQELLSKLSSSPRRLSDDLALLRNAVWRNRWPLLLRGLVTAGAAVVLALQLLSSGLIGIVSQAWSAGQRIQPVPEWLASTREDEIRRAREQLADTEEKFVRVDAAAHLSLLLSRQGKADPYGLGRGLLGQVHRDLEQLNTDLEQLRQERQATGRPVDPPLERIILYIDDLDRCPPDRVVQVLAAVHLMLALPLFVVIVAVDPRWLLGALHQHYNDMFTDALGPDGHPATPLDYLDKIFQIPFAVPPMSPAHAARLLTSLVGQEQAESDDGPPEPSAAASPSEPFPVPARAAVRDGRPDRDSPTSPEDRPIPARPNDRGEPGRRAGLILRAPERQFIARLGPLLTTPRSAKKLVNLYRLVRIGVLEEELPTFIGLSEYQVVQILLAILVGTPVATEAIFGAIRAAAPDSDIVSVVREVGHDAGPRVAEFIALVRPQSREGATDFRAYQRWCLRLARYSFYTRSLS
jgi:WD40 repeat protein